LSLKRVAAGAARGGGDDFGQPRDAGLTRSNVASHAMLVATRGYWAGPDGVCGMWFGGDGGFRLLPSLWAAATGGLRCLWRAVRA
jgi:hypothetical protein